MVENSRDSTTLSPRHQQGPAHDLARVQEAIEKGNLYIRPSADRDSQNLHYSADDIKACFLSLREENFSKSASYKTSGHFVECDVYLVRFLGPKGKIDDLYVKFSFKGWVTLLSFHLQRFMSPQR